jgi:hypothetical protein
MKSRSLLLVLLLVALQPKLAPGTVVKVPDDWPTIQLGIIHANNGDTVSVWGSEGVPPPYTYYENPICSDKDVFIVNRSYLGGTPGYDSTWDHA